MKLRILNSGGGDQTWRDYWVGYHLSVAFITLGYKVVGKDPDIDIFLHG